MTDADPNSTNHTTNISGGADLDAGRDITIGGDVVGRDKVTNIAGDHVEGDKIVYAGDQQYDVHGLANPYLGLQSFTYKDCAKYAGREKLIAETVACLTSPDDPLALLFVTGASGSGKSSFVQAGVLPALKEEYERAHKYARWNLEWTVFSPSLDSLAKLTRALSEDLGLPQYDGSSDFGDFLKTHTPPQQVNVIVIDQFEELFTQSNAQPRDALFNLLTHLPSFQSTHTHIIATVRADYLPELFALSELYDIAKRGVDLRAMSVDELREAIQQPLRVIYPDKDKRFQSELVDRLAKDAAEDAAYLPLLQVTLEEIWRKGTLTLGAYTNLADAIKQRADKVLAYQDYDAAQPSQPRSTEEQAAILNLCLDLVYVSLDDEARRDVRRRRSKDELISGAPERARLIDTLTQARLLSVDAESGEQTRVEVDLIHETLLSNWDRLRQAIAKRRHELRQRVRFEQQLKEWIGQNRSDGYLLNGVRLAEAYELDRRTDVALKNAEARLFVQRSIAHEEARRQYEIRNARRRAAVFSAVAVVALIAAAIAFFFGDQSNRNADLAESNAATAQAASTRSVTESNNRATAEANALMQRDKAQRQSQLSRSRELAAIASSQISQDPERGLLIAIEAAQTADTYEAQDTLRQLLPSARQRMILQGHSAAVTDAQFSPSRQWIVSVNSDGAARLWDSSTGTELAVLRVPGGAIHEARLSPESRRVVTTSDDKTVRVWDTETGQELAVLRGHEGRVNTAQFSPDGQRVVTASEDKTARIWNLATGETLAVLRGHEGSIYDAQFSPDGQRVVTASGDKTARVWNATTGQQLSLLKGQADTIGSAHFSPDGNLIVTVYGDNTAGIWDVAANKELAVLQGHLSGIASVQFSPDGHRIVTASYDGSARVWDSLTGNVASILFGHEDLVTSAQFSPDGKLIVTASGDKTARVWYAETGTELITLRGHGDAVNSAYFSPDGEQVVTAADDQTVRVWDVRLGEQLTTLGENNGGIRTAHISPDGKQIVTTSGDNAQVWDITTGKELVTLRGHSDTVYDAQFSPDGKEIVTTSWDHTTRIWNVETGIERAVFPGPKDSVASAHYSPDGQRIAMVYSDMITIRDAETSKGLSVLLVDEVENALFSPDSQRLLTIDRRQVVQLWDVATGRNLLAPRELGARIIDELFAPRRLKGQIIGAAFSSDGPLQVVTTNEDKVARVWDAMTGKELIELHGHEGDITSAEFSPDGQRIATASVDKTARVWDAATGNMLTTLRGHDSRVNDAQFSPDGQKIVTASDDQTVRIWEVGTGKELAVLRGYGYEGVVQNAESKVQCDDVDYPPVCRIDYESTVPLPLQTGMSFAQFSSDGKYILSMSRGGTARIFLVHLKDLIALAKTRVTRELTCAERVQYLHDDIVCPTPTPEATPTP